MTSAPRTILSVDDSLTIRKLIENALRPMGHEVQLAASGEEGLRLARQKRPDLILLDYVLPDLRGVEFCQRLQADEVTRQIPVLLISGHGTAIQELYHDFTNVVDYLTKPFAPNVLQAVVSNVLAKTAAGRAAGASTAGVSALPAAPAASAPVGGANGNGNGQHQKAPETTRVPAAGSGTEARLRVTPSGPDRSPPAAPGAAAVPGAALRQRVFEALVARLHPALPSVPAWEAARGEQDPVSYYLSRLLPLSAIDEAAATLAAEFGPPAREPESAYLLRGTSRFVSERHVLSYLQRETVTGHLRFTLPEEETTVFFRSGDIVGITTNHPRLYCAGVDYPFLQLPHPVVSAAMQAQREDGTPFFVTAHEKGFRPPGIELVEVLRRSGHRCLQRVYETPETDFSFLRTDQLPGYLAAYPLSYSLPQLLLESYRVVNDWQPIQEVVPHLELFVGRTAHDEAYFNALQLDPLELALFQEIDSRRNVAQLQEALDKPLFEVCRALYCLARIDLCFVSDLPLVEDEPTGETVGVAAAGVA